MTFFKLKSWLLTKSNQNRQLTESDYNNSANLYYENIINTLILFSYSKSELLELAGPLFDPMFELESEITHAFTPVLFESVFRNNYLDLNLREDLLSFKESYDKIENDIWNLDYVDTHPSWINLRNNANVLLDKIEIKHRKYRL
jgi:hypothetical protein